MGIYIKGISMPTDCPMCPLSHWDFTGEFRGCKAVRDKRYAMETEPEYCDSNYRPPWCPLVPVPKHGRLIDADALFEKIPYGDIEHDTRISRCGAIADVCTWVLSAPTIIEAEEAKDEKSV